MSTKDDIEQKVRDIIQLYDDPPTNEADTCYRVIEPLLESTGYKKNQIKKQDMDAAGKSPDYTVLPDTPYTWYLEAKTWNQPLNDDNVVQALNYANHNGKCWVVLSNGQEWRLYDNRIQGTSARKLQAKSNLKDEASIIDLLQALSYDSVRCGDLERYVGRSYLSQTMETELQDAGSVLIKQIFKELRKREGLNNITLEDVADYFKARKGLSPHSTTPIGIPPAEQGSPQSSTEYTLAKVGTVSTGRKPAAYLLPETADWISVHNWTDLVKHIGEWAAGKGKLPSVPYQQGRSEKRYILNMIPKHANGKEMREPRDFQHNSRTIFIETSAATPKWNCDMLAQLCRDCGLDPDTVKVRIRSNEQRGRE